VSVTAERPSGTRFSLPQLLLLLPWVPLVIVALRPITDNSFLWHVRAGTIQLEAGEVLTTDPFSFTMGGEAWLTQSWLAELVYAVGENATGLGFVPVMVLVLGAITLIGIGLTAYRRSSSVSWTLVTLILSILLLMGFLVPRPVIFSYALAVLVVVAWDRPVTRWTVPLLFWVWASVHGSFALGLAYVGLMILAKKDWRALPTAVVAGLATLATAHGLGVITMLVDFSQAGDALALISEWRRPALWSLIFTPFLLGVGLLIIGGYRRRLRPGDIWLLAPFLALAFGSTRAVPPAWIALFPLVASSLQGLGREYPRRFGPVPALVLSVAIVALPFLLEAPEGLDEEHFPVAASARLTDIPTFHDDRAGGYLIYAEGPDFKVYVDDRAELYGERIVEYANVRDGKIDWMPVFDREGIEQALLQTDQELIGELTAAGWQEVYADESYVVLRP